MMDGDEEAKGFQEPPQPRSTSSSGRPPSNAPAVGIRRESLFPHRAFITRLLRVGVWRYRRRAGARRAAPRRRATRRGGGGGDGQSQQRAAGRQRTPRSVRAGLAASCNL